jgi:hypothetical protein
MSSPNKKSDGAKPVSAPPKKRESTLFLGSIVGLLFVIASKIYHKLTDYNVPLDRTKFGHMDYTVVEVN